MVAFVGFEVEELQLQEFAHGGGGSPLRRGMRLVQCQRRLFLSATVMRVRCWCTLKVGGCLVIGPALRSIQDDASDNARQAEAECARGPSPSAKPDWRAEQQWPLPPVLMLICRRCAKYDAFVGHSCRCSRPRPALTALLAKTFAHTCCEYLQSSSHTALPSRFPSAGTCTAGHLH